MTTTNPAPKSERRRRNAIVSVRMSDDELAAVELRAEREGKPIAAILRESALATPAGVQRPVVSLAASMNEGPTKMANIVVQSAGTPWPQMANG